MKTFNQKGLAPVFLLIGIVAVLGFLAVASSAPFKGGLLGTLFPKDASQASTSFSDTFDGTPSAPEPFRSPKWSAISNLFSASDGNYNNMQQMKAHHGADCNVFTNPDPEPHPEKVTHTINKYTDSIFLCRNHMMTALDGDYSAAFLTPAALVDFSQGEATIRFDMSTFRASARDWVDFWITPFDENFVLPSELFYGGNPKKTIQFVMDNGPDGSMFRVRRANNFDLDDMNYDGKSLNSIFRDHGVDGSSAARRDTFEIKISRTHLKICLVSINTTPAIPINECWIDNNMSDLGWDKAIFQIAHHTYSEEKGECNDACGPNTWHWDNVSISPAQPFTMIKADQDMIYQDNSNTEVNFESAAPSGSNLRFAATGTIDISFDNGGTWQRVTHRPEKQDAEHPELLSNYWVAVPAGTTKIKFKGVDEGGIGWKVRHPEIWSLTVAGGPAPSIQPSPSAAPSVAPSVAPSPSPSPSKTPVPSPSPSPSPSKTPTPTPTATPTPTPTPVAGGSTIKIYAAGTPAEGVFPRMRLDLRNSAGTWKGIKTWTNVQGNPGNREFIEFIYVSPTKVLPQDIRVRFNNDRYNPILGQDRNLIVDKINVDGIDIETERPTTYSQGSWDTVRGCKAGNKQSEWLHCNGYFEYR